MINKIAILLISAIVAGCGGGGAFTSTSSATTGGSGGGTTTTTGQTSVTLSLTDASGAATTSISVDSPGTLKATVVDENGSPVSGAVVTFDAALASFNPTAGSVLTDSSGVATVTLVAGTTTGADTVTADATVSGVSATATKGYTVAAPSISLSITTPPTSPLSALGTTSLTVTVLDGAGAPYTTPVDIAFSSICGASGKASISSPVTTINGVATSNYVDQGCANTDTITASLTLGGSTLSKTASVVVNPATAGSIQFVSATPQHIALKGTGGAGLQETSTVKFKVVNAGGTPVPGATVDLSLSTAVGGIILGPDSSPDSAITDDNGEVSIVVNSGTVATAVRVFATVRDSSPLLTTQSDQMTITTGIPAQDHFSLSVSSHNIEGWDYDNECSVMTVHVSDHFGNPVPDGTAVNFISEGAQVGGDCNSCGNPLYCESGGACHTVNGLCRSVFLSSELRPTNGRVTVLAYGIGEEGFTDKNGDGYEEGLTLLKADGQPNLGAGGQPLTPDETEAVDANQLSTSLGEAWVDYNENNIRDPSEPFIDFNSNAQWDGQDGLYNGVLCKYDDPTKPNWCNTTTKNINVQRSAVIVLSGTGAFIKATTTDPTGNPDIFNTNAVNSIALDSCTDGTAWTPAETVLYLQITDLHGNALPGGTTVEATTTNGKIVLAPVSPLLDSTECVSGDGDFSSYSCPYQAPHSKGGATLFAVVMTSDATQDDTFACTNTSTTGYLTITVTTPVSHQVATVRAISVSD